MLGKDGQPLDLSGGGRISIARTGEIHVGNRLAGTVAVVALDPDSLRKQGGNYLSGTVDAGAKVGAVAQGALETSNVNTVDGNGRADREHARVRGRSEGDPRAGRHARWRRQPGREGLDMLDALYTAASGMLAQQIGLDVIANNLANVNTVGYKGQRAAFEDLLYNNIGSNQGASQGQQMGLGVAISGIQAQFDEGSAQNTGVATDFMITGGAGFFVVSKPDGTHGVHAGRRLRHRRRRPAGHAAGRPGARPGRPPDRLPEEHEVVRRWTPGAASPPSSRPAACVSRSSG